MERESTNNNAYKSKLYQVSQTTPTALWNDSCSVSELSSSIADGAVGATCNPVIVIEVLNKEWDIWKEKIQKLIIEHPASTEDELAWILVEEMSKKAAVLLEPIFEKEKGINGRLSVQTDPRLYRSAQKIVEQAMHFSELAPNIIVKIPATKAGIEAMEEVTYRGVSINATVSFTVPQAIAVAEAVERGLTRREKEGKDISTMGPVCTLMVGRLDDALKTIADKENIIANPEIFDWAGVAAMKKAYQIYNERGYRLRLLSAAFRNHLHWSQFIGGNVVISPPFKWQQRYNGSDVPIMNYMDIPVDPKIIAELEKKFKDFRRAYDENGMTIEEFDSFPATVVTLKQFCQATTDLIAKVRNLMLV
jgi:transaldolase